MRGSGWLAVAVGLVLAGAVEASAFTATYDQRAKVAGKTMASKVSMKNEKFRMETTMDGMASVIIHNENGTFIVMPDQGMAMKTGLQTGQGAIAGADNYAAYLQANNAQQIGTETINGQACDIYQFTDASTGEATKAWVRQDIQFPTRLEIASPKGKVEVDITNVRLNAPLADSQFELPPGVQAMDMGNMMGMFGQ